MSRSIFCCSLPANKPSRSPACLHSASAARSDACALAAHPPAGARSHRECRRKVQFVRKCERCVAYKWRALLLQKPGGRWRIPPGCPLTAFLHSVTAANSRRNFLHPNAPVLRGQDKRLVLMFNRCSTDVQQPEASPEVWQTCVKALTATGRRRRRPEGSLDPLAC